MKKAILSALFLTLGIITLQAQDTEDLDVKYTKGLLSAGTKAPDFAIRNPKTGKETFRLSAMRPQTVKGKALPGVWTLIDFWASWCSDCRREMPVVKEINDKFFNRLQVVGVSFDTDVTKMKAYCNENRVTWPQYCEGVKWKDTKISKQYNIQWLPTMYLIDPEGKVAFTTVNAGKMLEKLKQLDSEGKLVEYETMPHYPGGVKNLVSRIKQIVKYPVLAEKYKAEADVMLVFDVNENGGVENVAVDKYNEVGTFSGKYYEALSEQDKAVAHNDVRILFEKEAVRTAQAFGKWEPATRRGKKIKVQFYLPLTFRL